MAMDGIHRKHISLPERTVRFLEAYQSRHQLTSFSATVEAAASALEMLELEASYRAFAQDFSQSPAAQLEAETWLGFPMDET